MWYCRHFSANVVESMILEYLWKLLPQNAPSHMLSNGIYQMIDIKSGPADERERSGVESSAVSILALATRSRSWITDTSFICELLASSALFFVVHDIKK
jgi:hypothetical protein